MDYCDTLRYFIMLTIHYLSLSRIPLSPCYRAYDSAGPCVFCCFVLIYPSQKSCLHRIKPVQCILVLKQDFVLKQDNVILLQFASGVVTLLIRPF